MSNVPIWFSSVCFKSSIELRRAVYQPHTLNYFDIFEDSNIILIMSCENFVLFGINSFENS